jgi:small subunit ribosomal protein S19e
MATIYDINAADLVKKAAEELKKAKAVQIPDWAKLVRTGVHKERHPEMDDWWYIRAAAILRKVYILGPIGVNKLRTKFGGKKNRGTKPEKFFKGSGKIIRVILQQLTTEGLIKDTEKGVHKGKVMTPQGRSFMDKLIPAKLSKPKAEKPKASPKEAPKKEAPKEKKKAEAPVKEAPAKETEAPTGENGPGGDKEKKA